MSRERSHRACQPESAASWSNSGQAFQSLDEPDLPYLSTGPQRSDDMMARARQLNHRRAAWCHVLAATSRGALLFVDALAENPFLTAKGAARRLNVASTTAQRATATLERRGILEHVAGERRGRVYCAKALLKVLEAPARLDPRETA